MAQIDSNNNEHDKSEVWNRVLKSALAIPGARINRATFLKKALTPHFEDDIVQRSIDTRPALAGIPSRKVSTIALSTIRWHRSGVTASSFVAGLPGGWWMAGAIPADMSQFFWHVIVVLQKLAYLYGWPSLMDDDGELDDETLHVLTIFIGVMFGAAASSKLLGELAERVAKQVIFRLPKTALTNWGFYMLAKQIARWIGIKITKDSFARILSKIIPIVSGFISGSITWVSFSIMAKRLKKHLSTLRLHKSNIPQTNGP